MPSKITLIIRNGSLAGRELVFLERQNCLVGRSADSDLRLPGSDLTVSRRHCLLEIEPPAVFVCDLHSRNGTYVNGVRIGSDAAPPVEDATRRQLQDGDYLKVGETVIGVHVESAAEQEGSPRTAPQDTAALCADAV